MKQSLPVNIKINLLTKPYGVPKEDLRFSFELQDDRRDVEITGHRLVFASCIEEMNRENYLLDTGMVETSAMTGITVEGLCDALQENGLYVCKMMVQTNQGLTGWSAPLEFSTGITGWNPVGVWAKGEETEPDFCFLRHEFSLSRIPHKALLQITARTPEQIRQYVYQTFCNGEFVTLGPTRYDKKGDRGVLYYETVDITSHLKEGSNCIGAICYTTEDRRFAARLTVYDEQGDPQVLFEDASRFLGMDATAVYRPDQSLGTMYFQCAAENVNGGLWPYGWNECCYQGDFDAVVCKAPMGEDMTLLSYPAPVVGRYWQPASLVEVLEDGTVFVDLGKEIIGGIRLQLACDCPRDITIHYGEELTEQGRVRYQMRTGNTYEEFWRLAAGENDLTSIGLKTFRYVEIEGLPEDLPDNWILGAAWRTEFEESASYFTSSSELLNEIYDLCKYTIKATNQNLYVDSQSRERCAYEGDVLINMLTAAGVQDCNALSRFSVEYLLTHRTWPTEYVLYCITMVRLDYEYTGDKALLSRCFDLLTGQNLYLDHLDQTVGLIGSVTNVPNGWNAILVDWPMTERDDYCFNDAFYNTVFNCVHYRALTDLAYLAGELGREQEAAHYDQLAQDLKNTMIEKLYDREQGAFCDGLTSQGQPVAHTAQHATAFALYAGVFDSPEMEQQLVSFLRSQGKIRMSVYGAFFLLEGLYQAGAGDYANGLLLDDDVSQGARTWAYMLDQSDATVTTEAWNTTNKANMTWSHPWGSAPGAVMVRGLFGIRPLKPGFEEFSLRLQPAGLRYGAIQVPTVKGKVVASFDLTGNEVPLTFTAVIPAGAKARVTLPGKAGLTLYEAEQPMEAVYDNGAYSFVLSGGSYVLELK